MKWLWVGVGLIAAGGAAIGVQGFLANMEALEAVPADAAIVMSIDMIELARDLETEGFRESLGSIPAFLADLARTQDTAELEAPISSITLADIEPWIGTSVAGWAHEAPEGQMACLHASVRNKAKADDFLRQAVIDHLPTATRADLDSGYIWKTPEGAAAGRIKRILFLCNSEASADNIGAALDGDNIVANTSLQTMMDSLVGPIKLWVDIEAMEAANTSMALPGATSDLLQERLTRYKSLGAVVDINPSGITARLRLVDGQPSPTPSIDPSLLASEVPAGTKLAAFFSMDEATVQIISDFLSGSSALDSLPISLPQTTIDQLLQLVSGPSAVALIGADSGPLETITGVPVDLQLVLSTKQPAEANQGFTDLVLGLGIPAQLLTTDLIKGVSTTSLGFGEIDIVSWATRSSALVIGGSSEHAAAIDAESLSDSTAFQEAVEALGADTNLRLFGDIQELLSIVDSQEAAQDLGVNKLPGRDQMQYLVWGHRQDQSTFEAEIVLVMEW